MRVFLAGATGHRRRAPLRPLLRPGHLPRGRPPDGTGARPLAYLGGRGLGLAGGLGNNAGCLVWGVAAAAGVSELLAASQMAYTAVRMAGALYLTWLGGSALYRSWRERRDATGPAIEPELPATSPAAWST